MDHALTQRNVAANYTLTGSWQGASCVHQVLSTPQAPASAEVPLSQQQVRCEFPIQANLKIVSPTTIYQYKPPLKCRLTTKEECVRSINSFSYTPAAVLTRLLSGMWA